MEHSLARTRSNRTTGCTARGDTPNTEGDRDEGTNDDSRYGSCTTTENTSCSSGGDQQWRGLLDEEMEWFIAHRLVDSIRAMMDFDGEGKCSRERRNGDPEGTDTHRFAQGTSERRVYNKYAAVQAPKQQDVKARELVGSSTSGSSRCPSGTVSGKEVVNGRNKEPPVFEKARDTVGTVQQSRDRLSHSRSAYRRRDGHGACAFASKPTRALQSGSPRSRSVERSSHGESFSSDDIGRDTLTGGDGGGLTDAEWLNAAHSQPGVVRKATSCNESSLAGRPSVGQPDMTAGGGVLLDAAASKETASNATAADCNDNSFLFPQRGTNLDVLSAATGAEIAVGEKP